MKLWKYENLELWNYEWNWLSDMRNTIGTMILWNSETRLKLWNYGNLKLWNSETMELWNSETLKLKLWNYATLKLWNYETMELWNSETMELWNYDTMNSETLNWNSRHAGYLLDIHLTPFVWPHGSIVIGMNWNSEIETCGIPSKLWYYETLKGTLELWNSIDMRNIETMILWNSETMKLWNSETLKLWNETLKFWNWNPRHAEYLSTWIPSILNPLSDQTEVLSSVWTAT